VTHPIVSPAGLPSGARDPRHIERGIATAVGRNVAYRLGKVAAHAPISGRWLDCGCADGGYTGALRAAGAATVAGTDVEAERIARARERWQGDAALEFTQAPAEALPFPDESFDGVFFNEVLEHVDDEAQSLAEIRRVLKPGGTLAVLVPNRYFPFEGHGLRLGSRRLNVPVPLVPWLPGSLSRHVMRARNYWPSEIRELVRSNGFEIVAAESVFPIFEVFPWLPARVYRWYVRNLPRIERLPILRRFGVSTLVVGRKPR
jgi:ubiquinone/menaquinone biosynthesis C-methylase UbiE